MHRPIEKSTARTIRRVIAAAVLAIPGRAAPGLAQVAGHGTSCPQGKVIGSIGITQVACNCSYVLEGSNPVRVQWLFRSEPVIERIQAGGPADGRLRPGDVVVAIDGQLITTVAGGMRFAAPELGRPVKLRVRRHDREWKVSIVPESVCSDEVEFTVRGTEDVAQPGQGPQQFREAEERRTAKPPAAVGPSLAPASTVGAKERGWVGITFRCSDCIIEKGDSGRWDTYTFHQPPAVAAIAPGSPADRAGLRVGDVLTHVAAKSLTRPEGARALARLRPGDMVTLRYLRDGRPHTASVEAEAKPNEDSLLVASIREAYEGIAAAYGMAGVTPGAPPNADVSFSGTLGDVRIQITGPVEVTTGDGGLVIRGGGITVRLRETKRRDRNDG